MKRIITTAITPSVGARFKSGTLNHIKEGFVEFAGAALRGLYKNVPSNAVLFIQGAVFTDLGAGNYSITSGYAYTPQMAGINGALSEPYEVYQVVASGTVALPNTPTLYLQTAYSTGASLDPVTLSNGGTANIHQVRRIILGDSATVPANCITIQAVANSVRLVGDWLPMTLLNAWTGTMEYRVSYTPYGKKVEVRCQSLNSNTWTNAEVYDFAGTGLEPTTGRVSLIWNFTDSDADTSIYLQPNGSVQLWGGAAFSNTKNYNSVYLSWIVNE